MNFSLTIGRFHNRHEKGGALADGNGGVGRVAAGPVAAQHPAPVVYRRLPCPGRRPVAQQHCGRVPAMDQPQHGAGSPARVCARRQGKALPLVNHPLEQLLRRPNKQYDGDTLRKAIMLSLVTGASNAYVWIKRDKGSGLPMELWYIPHFQIWPYWVEDATTDNWLAGYVYRCNGVDTLLAPENVIHFRDGIDPYNQRLGLDLLDSGSRELVADNEASGYLVAMLKNLGITPVIISPKDPNVDFDQATRDVIEDPI